MKGAVKTWTGDLSRILKWTETELFNADVKTNKCRKRFCLDLSVLQKSWSSELQASSFDLFFQKPSRLIAGCKIEF